MTINQYSMQVLTNLSEKDACRALRQALRKEGLEVSEEVDFSSEIESRIGLSLPTYTTMRVWRPLETYQALLATPEAALFVPIQLAVVARDGRTLVMVVNPNWLAQVLDRISFRLLAKEVSTRIRHALRALEQPQSTHVELESGATQVRGALSAGEMH